MTTRSLPARLAFIMTLAVAFVLLSRIASPARADTAATTPAVRNGAGNGAGNGAINGALQIHVTAVQGGAQYRLNAQSKWQSLKIGADLAEGVEFRTGPRGTVQFTVGTDQVFRVDRLSVVKVLRASLLPDGNIKTDVGMTYGRVSKDVDQPARPHQDVIVSPAATLAVRGTHVSLYDQPPYLPEATSLTGAADYQYVHGQFVHFGQKGDKTAQVGGNYDSAAHYMIHFLPIDPEGKFSGRTDTEQQDIADGGSANGLPMGQLINHQSSMIGGQETMHTITQGLSNGPTAGQLNFGLSWGASGMSPLNTVVDFSVTSPLNETVSPSMPGPVTSGGFYVAGSSTVADISGNGTQTVQWGASYANSSYPNGTYAITETLKGTLTNTLAQDPTAAVSATVFAIRYNPSGAFTLVSVGSTILDVNNPSQTYLVSAPSLTPVVSSSPASAITAIRAKH